MVKRATPTIYIPCTRRKTKKKQAIIMKKQAIMVVTVLFDLKRDKIALKKKKFEQL